MDASREETIVGKKGTDRLGWALKYLVQGHPSTEVKGAPLGTTLETQKHRGCLICIDGTLNVQSQKYNRRHS
jgi:hypothetical protein